MVHLFVQLDALFGRPVVLQVVKILLNAQFFLFDKLLPSMDLLGLELVYLHVGARLQDLEAFVINFDG